MIIDVHAHIFPYLGGASGYKTPSDHVMHFQKATALSPAKSIRRVKDQKIVDGLILWDPDDPTPSGRMDVNFRANKYGRFEWTIDGDDYSVSVYAPSLQGMEAPPAFMIAEMDYAGINMAVLQNPWLYGRLNEYISEAVSEYPDRFIGQVQVNETKAYDEKEIKELRRGVLELGLKGGLYYSDRRFWEINYKHNIDSDIFFPFWEEVKVLEIPVYWCLSSQPDPERPQLSTFERYVNTILRFGNWQSHFSEIPCVLVHGLQLSAISTEEGFRELPNEVWEIWQRPKVNLEVLFPIQVSWEGVDPKQLDYPYPEIRPIIKELYKKLGPEKLMWGSDMPNVERNCTYKQSLDYLVRYCDFIQPQHIDMIVGGNAANLYSLNS
jgi:predicted TIM-barrel fold metal-dependent hydrolase